MRYGLLALSIAMLTTGGFAAQSALAISRSAAGGIAAVPQADAAERGTNYGSLPYTAARTQAIKLAAR